MIAIAMPAVPRPEPDTRGPDPEPKLDTPVPTPEEMKAEVSRRLAARAVYGKPRAALAGFHALTVLSEGDVDPTAAGRMIRLCLTGRPRVAAAAVKALAAAARARKKAPRRWCR
jgi:hypothetical protein